MWSSMMQWQYEIFRRQNRGRRNDEEAAYESLPVARAGRGRLLHRTVEWLGRRFAAWQALQDELDRPADLLPSVLVETVQIAGQHHVGHGAAGQTLVPQQRQDGVIERRCAQFHLTPILKLAV